MDHFCPPKCESASFFFLLFIFVRSLLKEMGAFKPEEADCCFYGLRSVSHLGRIKSLSSLKDVIWNGERLHNGYIRCAQTAQVSELCRGDSKAGASYRRRSVLIHTRVGDGHLPIDSPACI